MPSPRDIEDQFLTTYVEDMRLDRVRPLVDYQAMFPGHETTIAREYHLLEEDELGDSPMESEERERGEGDLAESHETIGRYLIQRELGRGGQARVYLAHDPRLGRDVALKVLETSRFGLDVATRIQRFRREAELAARLDHPGICGVLDVGEDVGAGVVFIAMRFIEGQTLAQLIAGAVGEHSDSRAVSLPQSTDSDLSGSSSTEHRSASRGKVDAHAIHRVLELVEKVARALHVAHEQGLVHRDVKPGNIMVSASGDPVVLDFGLARDEGSRALGLTVSSDVLGTPYYMSPEQVRGEHAKVDRRTDVYSLGVTLFESLTLRRPFQASSRDALYQLIVSEPLPDPHTLNRNIPRDLKIVLETALEKDRDRRYPNALAFADDLRRVRNLEPITARSLPVTLRLRRWVQRNPTVTASVVLLFVGLAVTLWLLQTVLVRNVELERIRIADVMRRVAVAVEVGRRGEQASREALLKTVEHSSFAWRWLHARNAEPQKAPMIATSGPLRAITFADDQRLFAVRLRPGTSNVRNGTLVGELRVLAEQNGTWSETDFGAGTAIPAFTIALSPDRKRIAVGNKDGIQVFDATDSTSVDGGHGTHRPLVTALRWSPDGRRLVTAGLNGSIKLWRIDRNEGESAVTLVNEPLPNLNEPFGSRIRAVDFSPDGQKILIAGDRDQAWIVDTSGAIQQRIGLNSTFEKEVMKEHLNDPSRILAARFSPDGRYFVLAGRFANVTLHEVDGTSPPHMLHGHAADGQAVDRYALDACFDPSGRFVLSSGADGLVQVHDVKSRKRLGYFTHTTSGWPSALAIDPSGAQIAVTNTSVAGGVSMWHLGDLQIPVELVGHDYLAIHQVLTTQDGYSFSVDGESVCKIELATGKLIFAIRDPVSREPACIALRPGKQELAVGYGSGHIEVFDTETGDRIDTPTVPCRADKGMVWTDYTHAPTGFYSLCYSPDGRWLVGGLGGSAMHLEPDRNVPLLVHDADPTKLALRAQLDGHLKGVERIGFFAAGSRVVSACRSGKLIVWDSSSQDPEKWKRLEEHPGGTTDGAFKFTEDSDGRPVQLRDGMLTPFDVKSDDWLEPLLLAHDHVQDLAFLPHGAGILVAGSTELTVWDMPPKNKLLTLPVYHRMQAARSVALYVPNGIGRTDSEGVIAGGAHGSLYYQTVKPPGEELFLKRQTEWWAWTLVRTGAAKRSVAELEDEIANATVPGRVREAALRILRLTKVDGTSKEAAYALMNPKAGAEAWRKAKAAVRRVAETDDATQARLEWMIPMLLGLAHYRLAEWPEAIVHLKTAATAERHPYPNVASYDYVKDFQCFAWCYLALAQHKSGLLAEAKESYRRAKEARSGRKFDAVAMQEAAEHLR